MKTFNKYAGILMLAVLSMGLGACDDDDDNINVQDPEFVIQVVSNTEFGNILVNQNNQAMYFFSNDVNGESNCTGGCLSAWPIVPGNLNDLTVGNGLEAGDFDAIERASGEMQLTYKGWPLYYFSPTANEELEPAGEVFGDGAGGAFYVAKPDYSIMMGRQSVEDGAEAIFYLVDGRGISLYDFINDGENISNCAGGCATVWPPFSPQGEITVPSLLAQYDFELIDREDDLGQQLSFNGAPLYYFASDEEIRGNVLGHGGADGKFFVVEQQF